MKPPKLSSGTRARRCVYFRYLIQTLRTGCEKVLRERGTDLCDDLNTLQMGPGESKGREDKRRRPTVCTLHVSDFIVGVPRDAHTLRALVGHDFNTSCLQQTYNQPRLFCEVG